MADPQLHPEHGPEPGLDTEPNSVIEVREAGAADVDAVTGLIEQLGYPGQPEQVEARLDRLRKDPNALVLIGERGGRVVGVVAACLTPLLERERPSCRLTALVVDETARGSGIGARLNAAVEQWAREQGAFRVELTSSDRRDGAHAFYEAMGYREQPKRLVKNLD